MNLNEIKVLSKSGEEYFRFSQGNLEFKLIDFWKWNQTNLLENRTRGILAEFIVKQALNIDNDIRIEWDSYDLMTKDGLKIEVKSAAYIQSWKQKNIRIFPLVLHLQKVILLIHYMIVNISDGVISIFYVF